MNNFYETENFFFLNHTSCILDKNISFKIVKYDNSCSV